MTTLTARTSNEDGTICAWVDNDGTPWIEQPFNPDTQSKWSSDENALAWANAFIAELSVE